VKIRERSPPCYIAALFMQSAVMEAFDTREMGSGVMTKCQPVDREGAKRNPGSRRCRQMSRQIQLA